MFDVFDFAVFIGAVFVGCVIGHFSRPRPPKPFKTRRPCGNEQGTHEWTEGGSS